VNSGLIAVAAAAPLVGFTATVGLLDLLYGPLGQPRPPRRRNAFAGWGRYRLGGPLPLANVPTPKRR
jgi:hypothetical protein